MCNELMAYDLLERGGGAMRLTFAGLQRVLEMREISDEADNELDEMGPQWSRAGMPPGASFSYGPAQKSSYKELVARGFCDWQAQGSVKFTDHGKRWVLEHRSDTL